MHHFRRLFEIPADQSAPGLEVLRLAEVDHVVVQGFPVHHQHVLLRIFDDVVQFDALAAPGAVKERQRLADAGLEVGLGAGFHGARAQVILHLQDARHPDDPLDAEIVRRLPAGVPVLRVWNKADLLEAGASVMASGGEDAPLLISAHTGAGLDALRARLLAIAGWTPGTESPWLARERHVRALEAARGHLRAAAGHAAHSDQVLDLFAEELRLAHEALCGITGEFTSDDLLGEIFSRFCIGK